MPYNTRRKSLSLPSLGIQLPNASRAHRPSIKTSVTTETEQPPTKKVKRSHPSTSTSPSSPSRPRSSTASSAIKAVSFAERPRSSGRNAYEHTPPPSPGPDNRNKIDTDGINDDIVTGVIEQLEKTGNRPHLIKELATVLSSISDAVASSANPSALLSSRLAAYIRRPGWTALSPCPLGKELIPVHPRKVFYFLTTTPRQEIPADSSDIFSSPLFSAIGSANKGGKRVISPSLSNASMDEDAESAEERKREALSPSPEVDLSAPELDAIVSGADDDFTTPPTPAGSSFSGRSSLARDGSSGASEGLSLVHNHRAASPPLEGDEKEFTQTASSMRMRGMSLDGPNIRPSTETLDPAADSMQAEETEEEKANRNREAAVALFGGHHLSTLQVGLGIMSSPPVKLEQLIIKQEVKKEDMDVDVDVEMEAEESISILGDRGFGSSWDIREPENIELEELDDLFGGF